MFTMAQRVMPCFNNSKVSVIETNDTWTSIKLENGNEGFGKKKLSRLKVYIIFS
jgi:hypothetical protein